MTGEKSSSQGAKAAYDSPSPVHDDQVSLKGDAGVRGRAD